MISLRCGWTVKNSFRKCKEGILHWKVTKRKKLTAERFWWSTKKLHKFKFPMALQTIATKLPTSCVLNMHKANLVVRCFNQLQNNLHQTSGKALSSLASGSVPGNSSLVLEHLNDTVSSSASAIAEKVLDIAIAFINQHMSEENLAKFCGPFYRYWNFSLKRLEGGDDPAFQYKGCSRKLTLLFESSKFVSALGVSIHWGCTGTMTMPAHDVKLKSFSSKWSSLVCTTKTGSKTKGYHAQSINLVSQLLCFKGSSMQHTTSNSN